MNIAIIANNYGKKYDGVGAFSAVVSECFSKKVNKDVYSNKCSENDSKIKRFTTMGMTQCILEVAQNINKYDVILIEYPFVEWNPLIVFAYKLLCLKTRKKKVKIVISLHEYERVNKLRKVVIRNLARSAAIVFVSNKQMQNSLLKYCKNVVIRDIPTNLYCDNVKACDKESSFAFFGLVNKTKAFDEMIAAWKKFKYKKQSKLYILSGTRLPNLDCREDNIEYIYEASDEVVLDVMAKCKFCIVPVKPEIDTKNGTFKTGAITGCMCIGKFCDEYALERFVINMTDYRIEEFIEAFERAVETWNSDIVTNARMFGERFTPHSIADLEERCIEHMLREET